MLSSLVSYRAIKVKFKKKFNQNIFITFIEQNFSIVLKKNLKEFIVFF